MAPRLLEGFLGAALLLAAIGKTADLEATGTALARLRLRPALALPVVAAEATVAVALLLGLAPAATTTAAVALGLAFVVVQLRAEPSSGCGCLGVLDRSPEPGAGLVRAGTFLAAALAAFGLRLAEGTLGLGLRPTQLPAAAAGGALAIAVLVAAASILRGRPLQA